jgi:signal transduction histidine kinase
MDGHVSTGLGLTFCKLAVEAHGGRINFECPPQGGTVFWFELPVPSVATCAEPPVPGIHRVQMEGRP